MKTRRYLAGLARLLVFRTVRASEEGGRPSLFVHSPNGLEGFRVDRGYLAELRAAGFEIDYTERANESSWRRLRLLVRR